MSVKDPGVAAFLGKCTASIAKIAQELEDDLKEPALAEVFPKKNHVTFAEHELEGFIWSLARRPAGDAKRLTPRQSEIYLLNKAGKSYSEMAIALKLKESTVAKTMQLMYDKLDVHSEVALAACNVLLSVEPRKERTV
jgi:DNA-binding CsgD family transcriptional regulator